MIVGQAVEPSRGGWILSAACSYAYMRIIILCICIPTRMKTAAGSAVTGQNR
jgi:hypothetical protein